MRSSRRPFDKVLGLELSADDYISKPFGIREVVARIRAVTRRYLASKNPPKESIPFQMRDLEVLPDELRARRGNQIIELSLRAIKILKILYDNKGKVVDRYTLFEKAWGLDHIPNSRTLDQHISNFANGLNRTQRTLLSLSQSMASAIGTMVKNLLNRLGKREGAILSAYFPWL